MARSGGWAWAALIVLGWATCDWLVHASLSENRAGPVRLVLLSLPPLAAGFWILARSANKSLWLLALLAAVAAMVMLEYQDRSGLAVAYGAPHATAYVLLAWLFGRTLRRGREPLITRLARRVHGTLPPRLEAYTRNVTIAWTVFFSGQVAISAILFEFARLDTWSLFVNVLNIPLLALMFAGEYVYRVTRYRDYPHASVARSMRAFAEDSSFSRSARPR
jgi:uncharacterized membrane protein